MAVTASTPLELVETLYAALPERVAVARRRLGRPLTLTEKVLFAHLTDAGRQPVKRGRATPTCAPTGWPCRTPRPRWPCSSS